MKRSRVLLTVNLLFSKIIVDILIGRLITKAITIKLEALFIFLIFICDIFALLFNFYLRLHNFLYFFDLVVFCLRSL